MAKDDDFSEIDIGEDLTGQRIKVMRIITRMNIGGPAVQVTGLMKQLDKSVFDQKLVTGLVGKNEVDYLIENNINFPVTRIKGLGRKISPFSDLKAFIQLVALIREYRPHIIHTHTAKAGVLGRTAWIFLGYKPILIHTFHGHLLYGYFGKFRTGLVVLVEKILALITNKIFVVGSRVGADLVSAGITVSEKIVVMHPGLEIGQIPQRAEICNKFNLDIKQFFCVFLGRVTEIKKPLRFIEIAELMKKINPNIHFLMIGSGELLAKCEEQIEKKNLPVSALGWISQVEEALAISDLMLLTSENEGMPISLIQAGMAGIPSIAVNVGSVKEVVIHNQTGLLLDYNSQDFVINIQKLAQNPHLYRKFGENALNYTRDKFNLDRFINKHKNEYLFSLGK